MKNEARKEKGKPALSCRSCFSGRCQPEAAITCAFCAGFICPDHIHESINSAEIACAKCCAWDEGCYGCPSIMEAK